MSEDEPSSQSPTLTGTITTANLELVGWESRFHYDARFSAIQGWSPWERVVSRGFLSTVEDHVQEYRDYIAMGKPYQIRPLYTTGPELIASAPLVPPVEEPAIVDLIQN